MLIGSKSLRIAIPTFATIAYSPVRSFSPRLGPFSLKNWDWTVTQSGPNFFGDCRQSGLEKIDRTALQSGPKIQDRTVLKSVRFSLVPVLRSGPASLHLAETYSNAFPTAYLREQKLYNTLLSCHPIAFQPP
jgi:hypothetical protein